MNKEIIGPIINSKPILNIIMHSSRSDSKGDLTNFATTSIVKVPEKLEIQQTKSFSLTNMVLNYDKGLHTSSAHIFCVASLIYRMKLRKRRLGEIKETHRCSDFRTEPSLVDFINTRKFTRIVRKSFPQNLLLDSNSCLN